MFDVISISVVQFHVFFSFSDSMTHDDHDITIMRVSQRVRVSVNHMLVRFGDSFCQDESLQEASKNVQDGEKALNSFTGLWLSGSPENFAYSGVDMQSVPTLTLQDRV